MPSLCALRAAYGLLGPCAAAEMAALAVVRAVGMVLLALTLAVPGFFWWSRCEKVLDLGRDALLSLGVAVSALAGLATWCVRERQEEEEGEEEEGEEEGEEEINK